MPLDLDDTIAAVASPPGGAARGILRISGPQAVEVVARCATAAEGAALQHIQQASALAASFHLGDSLPALPCELYVWPNDRSYTRQPAVEIHTLGSPPLLEAALAKLCSAGARLAEAGEFTMRAFLAGRIDLTQAEAVLGVIEAGGEAQLQSALAQLAGGLATPLNDLRSELLELLAHLEAGLDFVEEDIEFISRAQLARQVDSAAQRTAAIVAQLDARGSFADQLRVVLRGWPNVGKSSLLNALAGAPAAIVSDIAGTTRDYLVRPAQIDGIDCVLIDTAGIEPAPHSIEAALAQQMTAGQSTAAQVELFCLDVSRPLNEWEQQSLRDESALRRIVVLTKSDAPRVLETAAINSAAPLVLTSSKTGAGLAELRAAIARAAESGRHDRGIVASTALRCGESLRLATESLLRAGELVESNQGEELVALEIRTALEELGKVVGAVYTDDILDRVFSRFCIGK